MHKVCLAIKSYVKPARAAAIVLGIAWLALKVGTTAPAVPGNPGRIIGTVTADRGDVKAFRVKARDVVRRIQYTVFTRAGRYRMMNLPPSTYEISVFQPGFESPVEPVELRSGETQRVDLALTAFDTAPQKVRLVDYDTAYPPGPGRKELEVTCMGCHVKYFHRRKNTEEGWKKAIDVMKTMPSNSGSTQGIEPWPSDETLEPIIKYLAKNFGPDSPDVDLKLDEFVPDEDALADAVFIEYETELPPFVPGKPLRPDLQAYRSGHRLHDPYVSPVDGTIWYGGSGTNSMWQLNPLLDFNARWKEYKIKTPFNVFIHGNAVDSKGRVYWAEIIGGKLGELDPKTGEYTRHEIPTTTGSMLQVVVDSKDNVWYGLVGGSAIGKLDAKTRKISEWPTPIEGARPYGLAVDPQDNIWTVGRPKHLVLRFDPNQQKWTQYPTPSHASGTRRIGVDDKGKIWFTEYTAGNLGYLDPDTGKITEYRLPLRYGTPYEAWPDNRGSVWVTDDTYNSLIRFDVEAKKFTYYPLPQLRWSVPKVEVDKEGTVWFGSRGVPNIVAVAFKPKGNALRTIRPSERREGQQVRPE